MKATRSKRPLTTPPPGGNGGAIEAALSRLPAGRSGLRALHGMLDDCRACAGVVGPVVHGPLVGSRVFLLGQAPGPREGSFGRPFAWTAGRTLFAWWKQAVGVEEAEVRRRIYFAAVLRCFPGKAPGGGDRRPDPEEIARCRPFIVREVQLLRPRLVIPVGTMAIQQVLEHDGPLAAIVGKTVRARYHGQEVDVIPLPHPSGASTWHRTEPGISLLRQALGLLREHPEVQRAFRIRTPELRPHPSGAETGAEK